jgi:hypothetical protein
MVLITPRFNFTHTRLSARRYLSESRSKGSRLAMFDWHILYEVAVQETNPAVFERIVYQTEDAMCRRLQELSHSANGVPELAEIAEAAQVILELKTERLGWPSPTHSRHD